jgi:hypothetical protein
MATGSALADLGPDDPSVILRKERGKATADTSSELATRIERIQAAGQTASLSLDLTADGGYDLSGGLSGGWRPHDC